MGGEGKATAGFLAFLVQGGQPSLTAHSNVFPYPRTLFCGCGSRNATSRLPEDSPGVPAFGNLSASAAVWSACLETCPFESLPRVSCKAGKNALKMIGLPGPTKALGWQWRKQVSGRRAILAGGAKQLAATVATCKLASMARLLFACSIVKSYVIQSAQAWWSYFTMQSWAMRRVRGSGVQWVQLALPPETAPNTFYRSKQSNTKHVRRQLSHPRHIPPTA